MNPVVNQVLQYTYRMSERKGVSDAVQVARQWLEEIFKQPWWPGDSARPLIHHAESTSCDAVKFTYRASDAEGTLSITVFQTLFYIIVTVDAGSSGKLNAFDVARRLFNYTERLNLTVGTQDKSGDTGHQMSAGVTYREYDWLDTIAWWVDDKIIGFEMLKRTGPGRGTIVRPELEGNRTWFGRFGARS